MELEQLANNELAGDSPYTSPLAEIDAELEPQFEELERRVEEQAQAEETARQSKLSAIAKQTEVIARYLDHDGCIYLDEYRGHEGNFDVYYMHMTGGVIYSFFEYLVKHKGKTVFQRSNSCLSYEPGDWEQEFEQLYQKALAEMQRI